MTRIAAHLQRRLTRLHEGHGPRDRGDVPGWVLITVMTAGLVTALWLVAGDTLPNLFTDAVNNVKGP